MFIFIEIYQRWKYSLFEVIRQIRGKPKLEPQHLPYWVYPIIAVALILVVCGLTFADEPVIRWMRTVVPIGSDMWKFFGLVTKLGLSAWILILTGVASLLLGLVSWRSVGQKKLATLIHWHSNVNFIFFAVAVSGVLIYLIKHSIGRARPGYIDTLGPYHYDLFAFDAGLAGFPSGHSTTFGAMCLAIAMVFPWTRWWMLVLAVVGASSRVFLWAHYPSDVIAGVLFGAAFTWYCARVLSSRRTMFVPQSGFLPKRRLL